MGDIKGMSEAMKQAEAGLKLFQSEEVVEGDVPAATEFKDRMDARMAELDSEAAALTGKENKKLRVEKEREKAAIKNQKDYIDACKVVKGLPPLHGNFVKAGLAKPAENRSTPQMEIDAKMEEDKGKADAKDKDKEKAKPKKATESAGLSKNERDELEGLKKKIMDKKAALKEQGLSGGQQNKDEEVVAWVARMQELKEKECPGSTTSAGKGKEEKKSGGKKKMLDSETQALLQQKEKELEEYRERLRTEFKYSKKEIEVDPDFQDLKAAIAKLSA